MAVRTEELGFFTCSRVDFITSIFVLQHIGERGMTLGKRAEIVTRPIRRTSEAAREITLQRSSIDN
jgi:hypothetical protein